MTVLREGRVPLPGGSLPRWRAESRRAAAPPRCSGRAGAALATLLLLSGCNAGGSIVPPNDGFAIRLNLLCTTCDDFLRCRREPDDTVTVPGGREPRLVYRLKEKSFWAQIATIGDYLLQLFRQKTTDERPLAIYRDDGRQRTVEQAPTRAFVDAAAGTLTLPDSRVDLRSGDWLNERGERIGRCEALVRRDGYAMVREFLGRTPAGVAAPFTPAAAANSTEAPR
jgi:hypothetical protein